MNPQRLQVEYPIGDHGLNPEWLVGFTDGEGCFHVGISRHSELKFGYQILPELTVVQHERDIALLHRIRSFMRCGVVRRNHGDRFCWRVRKLDNLTEVIIPFFETYPLKSKKNIEFHKFKEVVYRMKNGEHLTEIGFDKIAKLASTMNRNVDRKDRIKIESMPE